MEVLKEGRKEGERYVRINEKEETVSRMKI